MKKYLGLILFFALFVNSAFGLPLVFKTQKEITADGSTSVEIATVDLSKYSQVRIGAVYIFNIKNTSENFVDSERIIRIDAVEESDFIFINNLSIHPLFPSRSIAIENPTNKIRISTQKTGTYRIYIWAQ